MLAYIKNDSPGNLFEATKTKKSKKKKKDKYSETMSEENSTTFELGYVIVSVYSVYPQYWFRTGTVSGNQGIKLVFHVIIPKQFWEWDENSFVSLRFGNPELGSWENNYGDFHQS